MRRIVSQIDTSSEEYRTNREHNLGLAKQLRDALYVAREQRPQRAQICHAPCVPDQCR